MTESDKGEVSHDKIFSRTFQLFMKSLIELLYPDIAPTLDLDDVEFLSENLFADTRRDGHIVPDLVAKTATTDGEPRLVLLHVETERRFRDQIDERMEGYIMMLTAKYHCPVISAVVFLSGGPEGLERREIVRMVGGWECSRVGYLGFGLSKSLAEEWVDLPQALAPALAALMRSEVWDRVEQKVRCLRGIRRAEIEEKERFTLGTIVETYLRLTPEEKARFDAEMAKDVNKEVRAMVLTWEEAMAESEAKGLEMGLARGRVEGRAEGEVEGKIAATRQAIVLLLKRRWASVPNEFVARLDTIDDLTHLYEILEQAMDARSVADLDLDRRPG